MKLPRAELINEIASIAGFIAAAHAQRWPDLAPGVVEQKIERLRELCTSFLRTEPPRGLMEQTRAIYLQKARDVAAGRICLLKDAPSHVPVLAPDLVDILEELDRFEGLGRSRTPLIGVGHILGVPATSVPTSEQVQADYYLRQTRDLIDALQKAVNAATGKRCSIHIETFDASSELTQARALQLIREAFEPRRPGRAVPDLPELIERLDDGEERFQGDIRLWLRKAERAHQDGWQHEDAWRNAFKPWLSVLVGWHARTELGRLAGEEGYALLVERFSDIWERE